MPGPIGLRDLANFPIGVAVTGREAVDYEKPADSNIFASPERMNIVTSEFSQITAENVMKMRPLSQDGVTFNFSTADELVDDVALANGLTVHGHALVWHPTWQLPDWAQNPGADFQEQFRNHVTSVAQHYAGKVASWDVVNEALHDASDGDDPDMDGYRNSVFQEQFGSTGAPEYIVEAFKLARAADPNAELYYNDFNTEENGAGSYDKTTPLIELLHYLTSNGAPIDGVGFQMHVLPEWAPLASIEGAIQRVRDEFPDLKIKITEMDVRINNPYSGSPIEFPGRSDCFVGSNCAGLQTQKSRYKDIVKLYLRLVPPQLRGGISVWGIADQDSWYYDAEANGSVVNDWPLLWDASSGTLETKPAYDGIMEALQECTDCL